MVMPNAKQRANQYAQQALELMDTHDVPSEPPNFEVWYNYVSDRFPDLRKTLDQMITSKQPFENTANAALYDQFISSKTEHVLVQKTGDLMQSQLATIVQALGGATAELDGRNESIRHSLNDFEKNPGAAGLEVFVQKMILETHEIQKTNAELQAKLEKSSSQIESLQQSLVKLEEENYNDGLTGIANRKKFDLVLAHAMAEANKEKKSFCLTVCDIDFFKKFNDTYGHQVGDQVLKLVANALHSNVKGNDLAARYGGEEFALILPETSLENAKKLVEKVREIIASRVIRNPKKGVDYGIVTMSLGIAEYRFGESATDLIERADAALYMAKDSGRNRTCTELEL